MRFARPRLLVVLAFIVICCLALVACTGSPSPYGPANGGTPAPAATTSSGY